VNATPGYVGGYFHAENALVACIIPTVRRPRRGNRVPELSILVLVPRRGNSTLGVGSSSSLALEVEVLGGAAGSSVIVPVAGSLHQAAVERLEHGQAPGDDGDVALHP